MIITRLNGGLGNQMFQYAIGRKLSLLNKTVLKLDISDFKKQNLRNYGLKHFNIIENIATPKEISKTKTPYGFISKTISALNKKILRKFNIGFDPRVLNKKDNTYLDGFWQSEKYFEDISDIIRQDFRLSRKMSHSAEIAYEKIKKTEISVSVHIRRGDYVHNKKTGNYHGTCSLEYYKMATEKLSKKLGKNVTGKIHLFIFSDDIYWVRKNLSFPYRTTFVSNPSIPDYEELILMSKCKHHIIANSSFSWWGAWLNPDPQKIVIAPAKWFNTKPNTYKDIVPNSWIKI